MAVVYELLSQSHCVVLQKETLTSLDMPVAIGELLTPRHELRVVQLAGEAAGSYTLRRVDNGVPGSVKTLTPNHPLHQSISALEAGLIDETIHPFTMAETSP